MSTYLNIHLQRDRKKGLLSVWYVFQVFYRNSCE